YSRNNPVNLVDPSGECPVCITAFAGAVVGVTVQAGFDLYNGNLSSGNTYAAAAAGGAVGGATIIAGPFVAGAAGSAAQSTVQQYLDTGTVNMDVVLNSGTEGAIFGLIPGPDIPGITSGKGSMSAVSNQISTKLVNGTIENISLTTGVKMFTVAAVEAAPSQVAQGAFDQAANTSSSSSNTSSSWLDNAKDLTQKD
ncbi:MAG: hypothetical protein AAB874_02790, partial [Patescibacteria group bacterium]